MILPATWYMTSPAPPWQGGAEMTSVTLTGVWIGRRVPGTLRWNVGGVISAGSSGCFVVSRGRDEQGRLNE